MLIIKRATLLPINCYYGILVLAKNEAVLISIPRYTVFLVYRPTLATKLFMTTVAVYPEAIIIDYKTINQ